MMSKAWCFGKNVYLCMQKLRIENNLKHKRWDQNRKEMPYSSTG